MRRFAFGLICAASLSTQAATQERILHVGLREDPDLLDPTLGSSYVGRIVFAGLCDKLFDIDARLNIVPVAGHRLPMEGPDALGDPHPRWRAVSGWRKAQCRGGEVQVAARSERQGQHAARRGQFDRQHRCRRSIDGAAQPEGAGGATAVAVDGSRRDHDLAQGSGIGGRQVRAASGVRRPIQLRSARRAGPHRAEALPRVLGRQVDPFRSGGLSAEPELVGAVGESSSRRARHCRIHPADRRRRRCKRIRS